MIVATQQPTSHIAPATLPMVGPGMMASSSPSLATTWPHETELLFPSDSTKVQIKLQHPLIRGVLSDANNNIQASLLFVNVFPDAQLALSFASDSLMTAAESSLPKTAAIHLRFKEDQEYFSKLIPVVHSPVCNAPRQ